MPSIAIKSNGCRRAQGEELGMDRHEALFAIDVVRDLSLRHPVVLELSQLVHSSPDVWCLGVLSASRRVYHFRSPSRRSLRCQRRTRCTSRIPGGAKFTQTCAISTDVLVPWYAIGVPRGVPFLCPRGHRRWHTHFDADRIPGSGNVSRRLHKLV